MTIPGAVIRQIDHILVRTDDVHRLFGLLSGPLALPVAWPVFPYRGFLSGAVCAGNVNVELLQPLGDGHPPFVTAPGTRVIGIAFEPASVAGAVAELDRRRLAHGPPAPFRLAGPSGQPLVSWTTVDLDGWPECPIMLLVTYDRDQDAHRASLQGQLAGRGGGPLGVERLREVVLGAADVAGAGRRWHQLLDPHVRAERGAWDLGAGPAVRLVESSDDAIQALVLEVQSRDKAERFLRERELLGPVEEGWLGIAGVGMGTLPLRLCVRGG